MYVICLIYSSTFHFQFIMMALTSEPCEIAFRYEKGKLTLDLPRRSGQEVQNQKDDLTARIDERIQKVSYFWVRLKAARAAVQQSVGRRVPERDQKECGA
jgi:hypothetical protein